LHASLGGASTGVAWYEFMATQSSKLFLGCTFFRLDARLENQNSYEHEDFEYFKYFVEAGKITL